MKALYAHVHDGNNVDHRIALVARRQHGMFTRAQALASGATLDAVKWRLAMRRWERIHPMVYRLAGSPPTWRQRAMAACLQLGPRAAVSHRAAAAARNIAGFTNARLEITVPRSRNRSHLREIKIHWVSDPIPVEDITTIDGIPVTKPARTLLDLAATEPAVLVERVLEDALRRRLVSLPFLDRWLRDPRRARRRGARTLRLLIDERALIGVTESPLETEMLRVFRDGGLPIPRLQYEVWDGDRFIGRVDFAYPDERLAIEVDGYRYHDDRRGFDDERARANDLQALGWRVLRVTSRHIEEDSDAVVAWVRGALEHAQRSER